MKLLIAYFINEWYQLSELLEQCYQYTAWIFTKAAFIIIHSETEKQTSNLIV